MAFKSDEDRNTVREMVIAGQGMKEILALEVCQVADVYQMRKKLKQEGISLKRPKRAQAEKTEPQPKKRAKKEGREMPVWLEGLLEEQERLQERLKRIDALIALYDGMIPLPKSLQH